MRPTTEQRLKKEIHMWQEKCSELGGQVCVLEEMVDLLEERYDLVIESIPPRVLRKYGVRRR